MDRTGARLGGWLPCYPVLTFRGLANPSVTLRAENQ